MSFNRRTNQKLIDQKLIEHALQGKFEQVCRMLDKGANVNATSSDGATALHKASLRGHVTVVRKLLEQPKVEVNAKFHNGSTALDLACQEGHVKVVRMLLGNKKTNVNAERNDGSTPLHIACQNGHVEVVLVLVRNDMLNVNAKRIDGSTALAIALEREREDYEVFNALIENRKDIEGLEYDTNERQQYDVPADANGYAGAASLPVASQDWHDQFDRSAVLDVAPTHQLVEANFNNRRSGEGTERTNVDNSEMILTRREYSQLLDGVSRLAADKFMKYPNLVLVTPISVSKEGLRKPRKWVKEKVSQTFSVCFVCAYSGRAGHEPFEIQMPRAWLVKVAPFLNLFLKLLKGICDSHGIPVPIPNFPCLEEYSQMKSFYESVVRKGANKAVPEFEIDNIHDSTILRGKLLQHENDLFKPIAEMAEKKTQWKKYMCPVVEEETVLWVRKEFQHL